MCPVVSFGQKFSTGNSLIVKIKEKSDKLQFRLLGPCFIEGKHFFKTPSGDWDIQPCPRINDGTNCGYCARYFSTIAKAKKTEDKTLIEQAKKEARPFQNSVMVYYPVIDRNSQEFKIFQTTMGMRAKIESEVELGKDVLKIDYIALNTGLVGKDKYTLSPVDSSETNPLTEKELEAAARYKTTKLSDLIGGTLDEDSGVAQEANTEIIDEDKVNF